ncbi:response regulator transcription factor (plasmid) [Rhizobium sp. CC1099]|uniref:response regulator transcription factor n=1 Tax=Rhizobium sp. CC1099 TaxID=3039160 RepID=UPI0024B13AA8|nr:response regulator transcription factor [Rhizobium sp. CC1099]WFU91374.1 response regulator transcription factor [Rhizobium sp. CC1099]
MAAAIDDKETPVIYIVDDDVSMREALFDLFGSMNLKAITFESPADFLAKANLDRSGCIVLDVRLPGISGLDFQTHLSNLGCTMPIIFMTGFGDISMSVRAMKAGAVDFLPKPFKDQEILDAVVNAIERDKIWRNMQRNVQLVEGRIRSLTAREREVMNAVVQGMMNKQIAYALGITEITVKLHRGNVMRKMAVRSVAELVRMVELAPNGSSVEGGK